MEKALRLILEKVQSGIVSVDEAYCLISSIFGVDDKAEGETKNKDGKEKETYEYRHKERDQKIEEDINRIFSSIMSEENKEEILRFKDKIEHGLKRSIKDWLND